MDARLKVICLGLGILASLGAGPRTQNFIVDAADPAFATQVAQAAEQYRRDLALEWLGRELPQWEAPCHIRVEFEAQAHGATSFRFDGPTGEYGRPYDWNMEVYGSPERIMDSVLPHEIMHTILASHFQRRLPRWLDEGVCSSIEHHSELKKQEHNLLVFLTTGKGIAFNKMVRMMEYPREMLPLYAQGFSVVRYLLEQESKPHFINFASSGLNSNDWDAAIREYYGFEDLSDLQLTWKDWVAEGSPKLRDNPEMAKLFIPAMRDSSPASGATTQIAQASGTNYGNEESAAATVNEAQALALSAPVTSPRVASAEPTPGRLSPVGAASELNDDWADDPYFARSRSIGMQSPAKSFANGNADSSSPSPATSNAQPRESRVIQVPSQGTVIR